MSNLELYYESFQHSYDGICIYDEKGTGIAMNRSAERITGFSSKEFIGTNVKQALEEGIISNSVVLDVLETGKTDTGVVSIRGIEILITASPIRGEDGKIKNIVANIRNIVDLNNLKMDQLLSIALKRKNQKGLDQELQEKRIPKLSHDIVAESDEMIKIIRLVEKIKKVDSTVLLLGESGVGKEVIFKLIHRHSLRREKPLITINCSAIPHHLLESELFGYEKGAFTGADNRGKRGLFEKADGGTIFLDEIGDMPLDLQAKLLRVLQEFEIMRIGGSKNIAVDIRIIAATNKDLEKLVEEGKFREDLFYRLNIITIRIPSLREREEDIVPLAHMFLNRVNHKYHLNKFFQPGTIELFRQYNWPGNVREMENLIERLVVTSEQDEISWSELPFITEQPTLTGTMSLKRTLQEVERKIILEKMEMYKTTRKAAKALGISQPSLVNKLKNYR